MPAILVNQIVKNFGKKTVVDNISFEVHEGEIFGLLGSNGAGKSTLMNMMIGLLFPDHGKIFVLDMDTSKQIEKIRRQVALVPQDTSLYESLTVYENLEFFGCLYHQNRKILKEKIIEMLDVFRLEEFKNTRVHYLSGGYKQRCSMACAFVANPKIVFLDEPLVGIDLITSNIILNYLKKITGVTVVVTTHSINDAESLCDRILFMNRGVKLIEGSPKEIIKKYSNLIGEQVSIEFDQSVEVETVQKYLEKGGFNISNLNISNNVLSFTILDLARSVLEIINLLKPLDSKIVNIDINQLSLEDIFNYVILENEKNLKKILSNKNE